jgi:hypothetical protein
VVVHTCIPRPWKAEAGRQRIQGQLGLHRETLFHMTKSQNHFEGEFIWTFEENFEMLNTVEYQVKE